MNWAAQLADRQDLVRGDHFELLDDSTGPRDYQLVDQGIRSQSEMKTLVVLRTGVHPTIACSMLSDTTCRNQHVRANTVSIRDDALEVELDPVIGIAEVAEQLVWARAVGWSAVAVRDEDIEETVPVVVGGDCRIASSQITAGGAPGVGNDYESARALILVEKGRGRWALSASAPPIEHAQQRGSRDEHQPARGLWH